MKQLEEVSSEWRLNRKGNGLRRIVRTDDFLSAFALVTKLTILAECQNHHPDLTLKYGKVQIDITTHDSNGLTKKDFLLAKAIDKAFAAKAE